MKHLILLFFCILVINTCGLFAQQLTLDVTAETSEKTAFINSFGYVKTHQTFNALSGEVDSLYIRLQKQGYLDIRKSPIKKINDSLFQSVFVLNIKLDSLSIRIPNTQFSLKQLLPLDKNATVNSITIPIESAEQVLTYLNTLQVNTGSPFSSLQLSEIVKNGTELTATLKATKSLSRRIDKIEVKGYEKFPKAFITYGARIRRGQSFNRRVLERKTNRLNSLSFANSKKPPEVLFTKDSTTVFLYLEKKKANAFDGFLGFSNDAESGNLEFNGYLDLSLTNNLNFGESLNLTYKADGGDQVQFKVNAELPYILKTPFGVLLDLEIFRRDSTFVTVNQSARLNYRLNSSSDVYLGYQGTTSTNLQDVEVPGSVISDFTSRFILGGAKIEERTDSKLFPTKYRATLNAQFGIRETGFSSNSQQRGTLDGLYNLYLNDRNSIYLRNTASALLTKEPLANELFRFGGILSIRGFEENSIDASLINVVQTEYRYLLSSDLYAHSVIDYAYYENDILDLKQQLYSFGFGFGLVTNAGLLKVVFANGTSKGQQFQFGNTKVHLSFLAKF